MIKLITRYPRRDRPPRIPSLRAGDKGMVLRRASVGLSIELPPRVSGRGNRSGLSAAPRATHGSWNGQPGSGGGRRGAIVREKRVRHNLGELPPCRGILRAEIGALLVVARLPGVAASVAADHSIAVG